MPLSTRRPALQSSDPAHSGPRAGVKTPGASLDDLHSRAPVAVNEENEMMINFSHRLAMRFVAASVVLGLVAGFAGSAEASGPSPTPNEFCGALNMAVSWPGLGAQNPNGVGVQPGGGMERAMTIQNPNGGDGMGTAVAASDCR
jgi:hypothetical protein